MQFRITNCIPNTNFVIYTYLPMYCLPSGKDKNYFNCWKNYILSFFGYISLYRKLHFKIELI